MFTTPIPSSARCAAWRSTGTSIRRRRIECTRCTSGAALHRASTSGAIFDEHTHSRSSAPAGDGHVETSRCAGRGRTRRATARSRCRARRRGRRGGGRRARRARRRWTGRPGPSQPARAGDGAVDQHDLAVGAESGRRTRAPAHRARSARRNAGSVFSGPSALAPRWAKVIGAGPTLPNRYTGLRSGVTPVLKGTASDGADACRKWANEQTLGGGPDDDGSSPVPGVRRRATRRSTISPSGSAPTTTRRARTGSGARLRPDRATARPAPGSWTSSCPRERPHELWRWPAELAERPDGPPLTPDDLLDLHVLLGRDGWFDELVALVRRTTPE